MAPDYNSKIYLAGHAGMVGSAIMRRLLLDGYKNIITRSRTELDLTNQQAVRDFFMQEKPEYVFLAAARVGGIQANNSQPAEFIYQNMMIEANVIDAAWRANTERLLFLGSSCIYPRMAEQPMSESALLTGPLEPTNEPYAIAKIAGIKLCESYNRQYGTDYRSVMPTNLYGPQDNYNLTGSHVIPALLRKFHEAKTGSQPTVTVWGSGSPKREFLYVDDMADACLFVMALDKQCYLAQTKPMLSHLNIGTGSDVTIAALAEEIGKVVGFKGKIVFDKTKPDGAPRKLLNVSALQQLGWYAKTALPDGLTEAYSWFLQNKSSLRC
ncbi:MAG: GDP-L-fucose synthase [Candidatus Polarisedimenticolaceae bacterium]|nr:GDP-L-fucose synthase [Candidatus Polarisedimenticolaceae bacterium]